MTGSKYDLGFDLPKTNESGIYKIQCRATGWVYIGGSVNIRNRLLNHISSLERKVHSCTALQYAWQAFGGENFVFSVLEYCEEHIVYDKEVEHQSKESSFLFSRTKRKYVTPTTKLKTSWEDPTRKEAQRARQIKRWSDPEKREKQSRDSSVSAKRSWADKDYRSLKSKQISTQMTKSWDGNAEAREKLSQRMKKLHSDPAFKARCVVGLRARWRANNEPAE